MRKKPNRFILDDFFTALIYDKIKVPTTGFFCYSVLHRKRLTRQKVNHPSLRNFHLCLIQTFTPSTSTYKQGKYCLDSWTEHLFLVLLQNNQQMRQGSSSILLMHLWIYPKMLRQVIAIIRESWFPPKLLKQSVLWMYMDYGLSRVVSCRGM
jgi:hypothetical protein